MNGSVYIGPVVACALALAADLACSASALQSSSPWTVVAVRERRAGEIPIEESNVYLRESPGNYAPGPDSLVARVTIIQRRGYIEVLDLRTGKVQRLLDSWASLPMWSPDGRYISCVAWKSTRQPYELTVVDVASKTVVADPDVRASGTKAKWSPDSRRIAVSGVIHATPRSLLYAVSIPDGKVSILDSLDVLASHDFSWSPDGRWLAFTKPTKLDEMGEDPIAADLWIAEVKTGRTWPLLETPEWLEANPQWITDQTVHVTRSARQGSEPGIEQTVVVEIRRNAHER